jgi:hypothetical protein
MPDPFGSLRPRNSLWSYLKEAFRVNWNMLLFGGATAAALISPVPDIVLPLVLAGELAYLGGLSTHPRFRSWVDRKMAEAQREPAQPAPSPSETVETLLAALPAASRERFKRLKGRCLDLLRLAARMRGASDATATPTPSLNQMLFVFLRLLASEAALDAFLDKTDEATLDQQIADLEARLRGPNRDDRIVKALTDSLVTARLRRDNLTSARTNRELVEIQLNRIEGQLQAIAETGISSEDPTFITSRLESHGVSSAFASLESLSDVPGLDNLATVEAPSILELEEEGA